MMQTSTVPSHPVTHINIHPAQQRHPLAAEAPQCLQLRQCNSSSEPRRRMACTVWVFLITTLLLPPPLLLPLLLLAAATAATTL